MLIVYICTSASFLSFKRLTVNGDSDEGVLISRDKWLWSQWRAVWVFSKLHRGLKPSGTAWLDAAEHIASFALKYGWDEKAGAWQSVLSAEGAVLQGSDSIYVDGFAIYGLVDLMDEGLARRKFDAAATERAGFA